MEPPSLLSGQIVPEDIQAIAGQTNEATRTPSDTPGAQEDMVDEAVDKEPAATFDEDRSGDLWEPSAQPCEDDSNSRQASADSPAYRRPEESAHQSAQPPSVTPESTDALDEPRQTLKPDRCPGSAPLRQEETVAQRHGPWKWLLRCLFGSK
jgi:hypothetical protein